MLPAINMLILTKYHYYSLTKYAFSCISNTQCSASYQSYHLLKTEKAFKYIFQYHTLEHLRYSFKTSNKIMYINKQCIWEANKCFVILSLSESQYYRVSCSTLAT